MSDLKKEIAEKWFTKAKHDLESAKILSQSSPLILDTAVYHCQQAAEKAVKGYLMFKGQEAMKTHDVGQLIRQAMKFDLEFSKWQDIADLLTPYATAYRYPGEVSEPTLEEAQEAIRSAESLINFLISKFV
jgi:HEPN domain-containing protein